MYIDETSFFVTKKKEKKDEAKKKIKSVFIIKDMQKNKKIYKICFYDILRYR